MKFTCSSVRAAYIGRVISLSVTYSVWGSTAPSSAKVENLWAAG